MAKSSSEQFLCIGDEITLHDEDGNVLVTEDPLETRAYARLVSDNEQTLSSEALGARLFQVEPQQSYSERRALEHFLGDEEERENLYYEGSPDELVELSVLESRAAKERIQNDAEKRRLFGKPVIYGQVIQLYNAHFKKYLTVTGRTCESDASHVQVDLSKDTVGYFKIIPRYRIRVDGEPVRLGDTVAIQCLRPEGFLNVGSHRLHSDVFNLDYYEIYTHTRISSWTLQAHRTAASRQIGSPEKFINTGQYLRFYHKEMEAYLEAPMSKRTMKQPRDKSGVRLRKHVINPLDPKESDSPLAFWEIENVTTASGSKIRWKRPVRIRHAASRAYLYIDPNNVSIDMKTHKVSFSFGLVSNPQIFSNNDATLFTLLPASDTKDSHVSFGTYVRVQHVLTKCWMHSDTDESSFNRTSASPIPAMQLTQTPKSLHDHRASRKSIASIASSISDRYFSTDPNVYRSRTFATPTYPITASQDFHYHDCFSITLVGNKLHDTFNYINEMIPQLHAFLSKERPSTEQSRFPIADKEYSSLKKILEALIQFCTESKQAEVSARAGIANEYHQALLRDIGAIEAAINIIQIPFNLSKRYELRPSLSAKRDSTQEETVSIIDLHNGRENRLRSVLLLCYNLLRVFLIQGEDLEEFAKNQQHVLQIAGDTGIELFIRHLTCGVGATDMMSRLLYNNTQVVDAIAAIRPQFVSILVNLTIEKLRTMVKRLIRCEDGYPPPLELRQDCEAASGVALLGSLCPTTEQHASTTNHGDYIASRLFSVDNCLLQTRIIKETSAVQVLLLGDDEWRDLEELLQKCQPSIALLLQNSLHLIYLLSMEANAKRLRTARTCVPEDVCLRCLSNVQLPDNIRAAFCDMLRVLYVNVPPYSNVLLTDFTLQYDHLVNTNDYPSGGSGDLENKTPAFFEHLKRWTMVFMDEKRHQFSTAKEEIVLLTAVLKLVHAELRLGFFTDSNDMKRLFRSMIHVLDGRTDARNPEHLKVIQHDMARPWKERYVLTEETRPMMDVKICILEIFDLIFDLRLHVRINKLASKWKDMENNVDTEAQHSPRSMLVAIFEETMLRHRENILMPILKDILKYQYAPLKRIAVIIMHRIYNDCEDLFKKAKKVLLLGEPQQVFVYHGVKKRLARIGNLLSIDRLNLSQLPALEHILRELLDLFQGKTIDMDDRIVNLERPQNQRVVYSKIFKNLSAHSLIARLLLALKRQLLGSASVNGSLSSENFHTVDYFDAEAACVGNMKLGLDLLYELVKDDREFQGHFVISHMDVLIDIGECHPMLASALIPICGNNLHISLRVTEAHIQRILDLAREYQGEYLQLLRVFVKAQGKVLKKHQDCIVCYIMDKREIYVPFETPEDLLAFGQADYCAALLELLSVCGQNDNTFAQSFARTLFSIHDLVTVINSNEAQLKVKAGAFQFLSSIYLDNVEVPSSIPISEDTHILSLMESCCLAMSEFEANSTTPEMIHCIYHGVLVFLRSMFEHHLSAEIIVDDKLQRLCPKLVDLTVGLLQSNGGCDRKALKNALACLDSMINVAGFGSSIEPDILREKLRRAVVQVNDKRDKLAKLLDSINAKFQGFIRALMAHNDVKMLMQNEFKQLGSHFSLAQSSSKDDVKSLIDYLSMMTNVKEVDPREAYQVATIRLLEEIPLQYIRERSKQNHLDDPVRYELLEKKKMHAQNTLNRLGCTLVAQNLLSSPRKNIFEAAVKLLIALLEGGNKNVQDRLEEYFYSIREERFFYSFHHRLQTSIESLKEAQVHLVRAAQKMNRQQFTATNETKRNGAQPNQRGHHHRRQPSSLDPSRRRMTMYDSQVSANQFGQQSAVVYQKFASLMAEETAEFGTTSEEFDSMRDTMRALQLMVEGHNINLQRYLAKQPDNIKSFNIVQDVVEYLHAIAPICNIQNVRLIIQVLDTITDLAQGCPENQLTIFTHKIVHPANIILRESYNNCPSSLIDELKSKVMICLLSLLEGGMDNSEMIFREMADSLDLSVVIRNMSLTFDSNVEHLNSSGVYEKLNCGFQYCMLLMTLWPALPECQRAILEGNKAFEFFQRNTGKIEVVMDYNQEKQLSRVLFPIPEICKYLREDTKQRFLWNVKRDSPSAKIEDFVQLSNNIIYEIESHAKVASNKYLSILSNHSKLWWKAAYVTTVLLNMLMLGCSSTFLTSSDPMNRAFRYRFEGFLHGILGLLHIIFWGLSTAEFSFVQLPIIVNRNNPSKQRMFGHDAFRSDITTMEIFSQTVKIDLSSIAGRLLERSFLYHVIMLCLSFVGFYNPSFYSLHLLDFAFRDRILQGVIASITLNVNSISRTALFGIIVVYIHSVVAYVFFREEFDISKGLHCSTLSQCFVTILSHGVRAGGGIGDILEPDVNEEPRGWRTAFEMSFFLLVVVFLLNAIFGIIFDTFGHLRDERSAVQQDIKNSCFICSIPAIEFQRQEKNGFDKHVRNDHNIWQYLFFLVHLKTKDRTEYTGPESYVADCLKDANYNFFPVNRALCLKQKEDNDTERLEKLEETAHKLLEKVNNLEEHLEKLSESQSRSRSNSLMLSPM